MKKKTDTAYTKGIFSSLVVLLFLAVLTVFPNVWDNLAKGLKPLAFKAVPFAVLLFSSVVVFCLLQGISYVFYTDRKGERVSLKTPFRFFAPKSFFRMGRLWVSVFLVRLFVWGLAFLPPGIVAFCTYLFYKNGCPLLTVLIMSAATAAALVAFLKFYGEMSLLFVLSPYCFFENEKGRVRDILRESFEKSKGKGRRIRRLRQSFFLPFLSCVFLVPIPFVLTNYKSALTKRAYDMMREG